jgi:TRAP-type C4-dicarboxylate transport system substrate-binding protein
MKSPTAMDMIESFGGNPTPISWGELYTSLQTGRVDAAENNPPSFYHSHHYEVCKYYCLDEHTAVPDVLLISTIIWEQLSDREKEWLEEAAHESSVHQRILWQEDEARSIEEVRNAGVEIITSDQIDREAFKSSVEPMYLEARKDKVLNSLIDRINKTGI